MSRSIYHRRFANPQNSSRRDLGSSAKIASRADEKLTHLGIEKSAGKRLVRLSGGCDKLIRQTRGEVAERLNAAVC